jgi:hypothetical protein
MSRISQSPLVVAATIAGLAPWSYVFAQVQRLSGTLTYSLFPNPDKMDAPPGPSSELDLRSGGTTTNIDSTTGIFATTFPNFGIDGNLYLARGPAGQVFGGLDLGVSPLVKTINNLPDKSGGSSGSATFTLLPPVAIVNPAFPNLLTLFGSESLSSNTSSLDFSAIGHYSISLAADSGTDFVKVLTNTCFIDMPCGGVSGSGTFIQEVILPSLSDSPFQVRYTANLQFGESFIDITNTGANGAALLGPGFGAQAGNICANVYAFDAGEEMISCCSCFITPDETVNLGVTRDLTVKTLTGVVPTSVTVKLLATLAGTNGSSGAAACTNSAATVGTSTIVGGMAAWGTTPHASPTAGSFATTETKFTPATLSTGELASLGGRCASILGNGSTFGVCQSCRVGALGGSKLPQ